MKICKNCKYYRGWYGHPAGYCTEIFQHLDISSDDQDRLVYADVIETFVCGAFEGKE